MDIAQFEISRAVLGHESGELVRVFEGTNGCTLTEFLIAGGDLGHATTHVRSLVAVDISGARSIVLAAAEGMPGMESVVITEYARHQNDPTPPSPTHLI